MEETKVKTIIDRIVSNLKDNYNLLAECDDIVPPKASDDIKKLFIRGIDDINCLLTLNTHELFDTDIRLRMQISSKVRQVLTSINVKANSYLEYYADVFNVDGGLVDSDFAIIKTNLLMDIMDLQASMHNYIKELFNE